MLFLRIATALLLNKCFFKKNIMYRFFLYCFLLQFLFTPALLTAQNNFESLEKRNYKELNDLYNQYSDTDSIVAKKIAHFYLKRSKENKDTLHIIKGYLLCSYQIKTNEKIKYLDSAITIAKNYQNTNHLAYAYFDKAEYFLYQERNIQKTLNNLIDAHSSAKANNNEDLLYKISYLMGIVKSEHLDEKEDAILIYKKCAEFYNTKDDYINKFSYLYSLHAIAETYIDIKKNDSTTYYNKIGYHKSQQYTDKDLHSMKTYFTLCEGINQYAKKKYTIAIDSINTALPNILEFGDKSNTIDCYFYLGKSYNDLGNKEKGIVYFKKTDSILETLHSVPQYKHIKIYEYIKDYYKGKGDLQNQNKYLNKLNGVLNNYLKDQFLINKKIKDEYDIPLLLEEQQVLIKKLNKNTGTYIASILLLVAALISLITILFYQHKKKRLYRLRFEKLMSKYESVSKISTTQKEEIIIPAPTDKTINVPEKHIRYIIDQLEEFEKNQKYLDPNISAQSLADDIKTNVKYLSLVINHYKNKPFISYLNELRVTYAIKELKENITLRKFTIKAIANETGYNSAETFSNAFYKQIGIKPSYYIKQLEKESY